MRVNNAVALASLAFDAEGVPIPEELGQMHHMMYEDSSPFSPEGADIRRLLGD